MPKSLLVGKGISQIYLCPPVNRLDVSANFIYLRVECIGSSTNEMLLIRHTVQQVYATCIHASLHE